MEKALVNETKIKNYIEEEFMQKRRFQKGKKIKLDDLTFLRPQKNGMSASEVDLLIDKISLRTINKSELN